jgi:asparagine synthase (glutamine-hydrolysing)
MKMKYRGPDAHGTSRLQHGLQLGHVRLSILDLDPRSNQPFVSTDGRYQMVYNGEIYNFKELIQQFSLKTVTSSDTEVLLLLYQRLGADMLRYLNGMFAFVIVDTHTGEWFAARDRLGVKPLYYAELNGHWYFSSEIAPILHLLEKSPELDPVGLRQYRKLRTFFNGRTLYAGISMFPAGAYMQNHKISRFWQLQIEAQAPPSQEELAELIQSAVAYRCIADVSVGSYLSGGLDSSIVAGLAGQLHTWTVGFPQHNEFEWAALAAQQFGTTHHEVVISPASFLTLAAEMIAIRKEPLSVPNEVLIYRMTQAVKAFNTVILSGEGADELFFGYDRIFRWAADLDKWDDDAFARLYAYGSEPDPEIIDDALAPFRHARPIDTLAAFFQIAHLHGLLRRLDFATMLCGVEARVPFVDYRLVERLAGVPFSWKMYQGIVKQPLKTCFASLLPAAIIERPKVGFPVPLHEVLTPDIPGQTPMDQWFAFNLKTLEASRT